MDWLPKEIIINILQYLDVNTENTENTDLDTISLLNVYPIELTNNDWGYLFSLRFNKYFTKYLYTSNTDIKDIYLEMLLLEPVLHYLEDNVEDNMYDIYNHLNVKNALKYLMLRGFIYPDVHAIANIDDIELLYLDYIRQDINGKLYSTEKLDDHLIVFIADNSLRILEHIFKNKLYNEDNIKGYILEAYQNGLINLNTTKLIFKYITFTNSELLDILIYYDSNEMESYYYIFDMLPDDIDVEYLSRHLINYSEYHQNFDTFEPLWNKYSDTLSVDDLIKIYQNFNYQTDKRVGGQDDLFSLITLVAQHTVIKDTFLKRSKRHTE